MGGLLIAEAGERKRRMDCDKGTGEITIFFLPSFAGIFSAAVCNQK